MYRRRLQIFDKQFRSRVVAIECSKGRTLEVFSSGNRSDPPASKKPFRRAPSPSSEKPYDKGDLTTIINRTIETDITGNMVGNKTANEAVVSQVNKVLDQKLAPLSRKFPDLIPNIHPLVKKFFTGKILNLK